MTKWAHGSEEGSTCCNTICVGSASVIMSNGVKNILAARQKNKRIFHIIALAVLPFVLHR